MLSSGIGSTRAATSMGNSPAAGLGKTLALANAGYA